MEKERRAGLTVDEQKDMYDKVHKLHTILIGNGVKGKLKEFEETDERLERRVSSLNKRLWIASGFVMALAFIAPYVIPIILGG